jgi:hypothetical protein
MRGKLVDKFIEIIELNVTCRNLNLISLFVVSNCS